MNYKVFFFSCTAVLFSYAASAAIDPGNGTENASKNDIVGGVYSVDSKKPLGNVTVTAYASNKKEKKVLTDDKGNFSFDDLKPGVYKFVFQKDGYKRITREKVIHRVDEAYQLNIKLEEHPNFDFMPGPSHFFDN